MTNTATAANAAASAIPGLGLTAAPTNYPAWEYAVLAGIGAPATATKLQALSLWQQSEGTNPANNNWLAVDLKGAQYPQAGVIASNGGDAIPAYANEATGVAATVQAIKNNPAILAVFQNSAGLLGIWRVINASGWCKGCQGGLYPVALSKAANASAPGAVGPGGSVPSSTPTAGGSSTCLLNLPVVGCVLTESNAKAILGGMAVASGVAILGLGLILIFAFGLTGSRAGRQATSAARRLPGPLGSPARRQSASRSSPTPAGGAVDDVGARAQHGPPRGGTRPRGSTVPARHAIAEHNRQADAEQSYLRAQGRAQDRRNVSSSSPRPRQPASSTAK